MGVKGAWQIFRYQDVQRILSDHDLFSNEFIPETAGDAFGKGVNITDPPRHSRLRSLVNKALAPSVMKQLESWLYSQCEKMLSPRLSKGSIDFVKDFADIFPAIVIAQLLGVPAVLSRHPSLTFRLKELPILFNNI